MLTGQLFKRATCLSLTLLSALLPGLEALAQSPAQSPAPSQTQSNQNQPGVWTPNQPISTPASSSAGQSGLPPIAEPVIEPSKIPPLEADHKKEEAKEKADAAAAAALAATTPKTPVKPFSSVADPLVTHPGVDDDAVPTSMVAPVFKPGSKAALDQEKMRAEQKVKQNQPMKLYGRIEQLTATTGANFPITLKAMTPQLDTTPGKKLTGKVGADPSLYSGTIAKSFPSDFRGNWGGTISVWNVVQDPSCYKIDPVEANKLVKIFHRGAQGQVNFLFSTDASGGNYLAPAKVLFQTTSDPATSNEQMSQVLGGQSLGSMGAMGQMMQQMAANMPVPVVFYFGDGKTDPLSKGLSGNSFEQHTLRNNLRQLAPNVLEQQIVAEMNETVKATGQPRKRYSESVLRFTKVNEQQMYVQAAQVTYWQNRSFQDKVIMYGYVTKGQVVQTDPYASMMGGLPGGGQIPGGGSIFGGGGSLFGGAGAAGGGAGGGLQINQQSLDALKKMFGQ